jgi:2'-5' RNA ligase
MPRFFFALWPDDLTRSQLAVAVQSLPAMPGRPVPVRNLHITLVFLGDINAEQQQVLRVGADAIHAHSFALAISQLGCWPHAAVAWLAPDTVPPALIDLVAQLQSVCRRAGLEPDMRPYHPHLTIMRKVRHVLPANLAPIHWQISRFSLIESVPGRAGSEYHPLAHWPLFST